MKGVFLLVIICLLGFEATGVAQEVISESTIPPAPQSHLIDKADLFRGHPEQLAKVEQSLAKMQDAYAYPVYIAIYYSVLDGDLQTRADSLHKAWIGEEGRGMVVVYQKDPVYSGDSPAVSFYKGSELSVDTSEGADVVPGREVEVILAKVLDATLEDRDNHPVFISNFMLALEDEIKKYHQEEVPNWSDSGSLTLMGVFLGAIVVFTLLGCLIWKLFSKADVKSSKRYYFPDVNVGRRLNAPYGGGWVSEKTFVPASSRK